VSLEEDDWYRGWQLGRREKHDDGKEEGGRGKICLMGDWEEAMLSGGGRHELGKARYV